MSLVGIVAKCTSQIRAVPSSDTVTFGKGALVFIRRFRSAWLDAEAVGPFEGQGEMPLDLRRVRSRAADRPLAPSIE